MIQAILIAGSLVFCGTQAFQGEDMDDSDFASYLEFHENVVQKYGESAAKGCIDGVISNAPNGGGFKALCIGCATGAATNTAKDIAFPSSDAIEKIRDQQRR